jgi:hypothetical protein
MHNNSNNNSNSMIADEPGYQDSLLCKLRPTAKLLGWTLLCLWVMDACYLGCVALGLASGAGVVRGP